MSTKYIASNWRLPNEENSNKSDNYGLTFDGTEYIDCGDSDVLSFGDSINDSPFSISAWINMDNASNFRIVSKYDAPNYEYQFDVGSSNKLQFYIFDGSNYRGVGYDTALNTGEWYHVIATYDGSGSSSGMTLYLNGLAVNDTTFSNGSYTAMHNTSATVKIGRIASSYADGKISEVAVFDYALSSTQISTLYGSSSLGAGNPMALKPQPVAFYPLGDNSASNPLTQPNEAVEDASVFEFDGSNQYIDGGNNTILNITNDLSVSVWFKTSNNGQIVTKDTGLNGTRSFSFGIVSGKVNVTVRDQDGSPLLGNTTLTDSNYNDGNWHHAVFTYLPSSSVKIYVDGNLVKTNTSNIVSKLTDNPNTKLAIGSYQNGAFNEDFNGEISNVQIWNTELSSTEVTTLYNSGVPLLTGTQPQASNLKAWYKLDQSANWEADTVGNWQIPDAVSAYPQSFSFDGSTQKIQVRNDSFGLTQEITVSAWVRIPNGSAGGGAPNIQAIVSEDTTGGTTRNFALSWRASTLKDFLFEVFSTDGTRQSLYSNAGDVNDGKWHHVVGTWDGTTNANAFKIYVDNVATSTTATKTGINIQSNVPTTIGAIPNTFTWAFEGNISNVQIWDTSLDSTQVETLYNNGTPLTTAIASDNLKGWWKLDNTATFSTNWSIPDASGNGNTGTSSGMTEQNLVNNNVSVLNGESNGMTSANLVLSDLTRAVPYDSYSFNFDGTNDYIDCGNNSPLNINGDLTISAWVNIDIHKQLNGVVSKISSTDRNYEILVRDTGQVSFYTSSTEFTTSTQAIAVNTWTNIIVTVESGVTNGVKFYFNGVQDSTTGTQTVVANTANLNIGRRTTGGFVMDGKISNLSIFNEALTSTEVLKLYSNGVPQDLANFTPAPIAWWPLGSNSFWNGSQWTVRDMSTGGSNDGTGQNIGIDGLVGNAPRSEANGTGTNNSIPENLVGTTKWSSNNSWSINMSSTARVEDTP